MKTGARVSVDDLAVARRETNAAEAHQIELMFCFEEQRTADAKHEPTPMTTMLACTMIAQEIGDAIGMSEGQVRNLMYDAGTVRDRAPLTWRYFANGLISLQAVRAIADAINRLTEVESVSQLDDTVGPIAADHTVAELRVWLRRFVVRVEAEAAAARAEAERAKRFVAVEHGDDGMSTLKAYLPSHIAAAIERRLKKEARKQPKDGRTLPQKQVDLFASWLTMNENGTEPAVNADIAVTIDADVLAGIREGFGISPDGGWVVPARWVVELALTGNPFWFRIVQEPVTKDILSIDYQGRFAPEILKRALYFRDGTCQVPGCLVPAWDCEIDHIIPWPHGPTNATNTQPLSKGHHGQKGHGVRPQRPAPALDLGIDLFYVTPAA